MGAEMQADTVAASEPGPEAGSAPAPTPALTPALPLSVVIPVWNDPEGLARLLPVLTTLPGVAQIIVVDDASDVPVGAKSIGLPGLATDSRILWLRSATQKGAGHARNLGLARVDCPHVLFFDSDDLPLPGLTALLADLAALPSEDAPFDFCLFRHIDSRTRASGTPGPLAGDQRLWDLLRAAEAPAPIDRAQAARMVRIAAYPWNKIYRTAFLRAAAIRCTEIPVHNDVELHWTGFFHARRILVSTREGCEHFVAQDGTRLTNRSGLDRFEVFQALEAVQAALTASGPRAAAFGDAAAEFYLNLFRWIDETLEPELRATFRWRAQDFLRRALTPALFTLVAQADPDLAGRINRFLAEGRT